jgi:hypothetical protein
MTKAKQLKRINFLCYFFSLTFALPVACFCQPSLIPIRVIEKNSLQFEWARKPIIASKRLVSTENLDEWQHKGFGSLSISNKKLHNGHASLLLQSPTATEKRNRGRAMGASTAVYSVPGEDWSQWNRISFWIYPDLPGFKVVSIGMIFHNDGAEKVPDSYNRNGFSYQILENQKWNKVNWEIAHLGRDKVTSIELRYRLQGNERNATDTAKYYIDDVFLEKVKPDDYEGWDVAQGHIAYNNLGYVINMPKTALTSNLTAKSFSLINSSTGKTVFHKAIATKKTAIGSFQILNFDDFNKPGTYILKVDQQKSQPFKIGNFGDIYMSSILKTINLFYSERCGFDVPGSHEVCHADWTCIHDDKSLPNNGGWHDAGDLSQGLVNTSEAAYAMFALAEKIVKSNPGVANRLIEEAKWGLDWMLKTRFGDGYRSVWSVMDSWTDGINGTKDDVASNARNNSFANYLAAKAEAEAAMVLKNQNSPIAKKALKAAEEDWGFAKESARNMNLELVSAALNASLNLYQATGKDIYKNEAVSFGDYVLQCQQQENVATDIALKGFFYSNSDKQKILHYTHAGHEQAPVAGLVGLCKLFPADVHFKKWKNALHLYAGYYKEISKYTTPYFMLPSGLYDVTDARNEVEKEQIKNGFRLNDRYYIKCFPVWTVFRGNSGTVLSQAAGLGAIADYLNDKDLLDLSYKQLNWQMGQNPFCQSLMYGEGYRFADQYTAMSGNIVGGLPVGVQTHFNRDQPYWPAESCYNWKEIWVHPSSRWLWNMCNFF